VEPVFVFFLISPTKPIRVGNRFFFDSASKLICVETVFFLVPPTKPIRLEIVFLIPLSQSTGVSGIRFRSYRCQIKSFLFNGDALGEWGQENIVKPIEMVG